jgi:hypothetical protein
LLTHCRAFDWVLYNGFIPTEFSYGGYSGADGVCHVNGTEIGAKLKSYVNVTSADINVVLQTLATSGPLSIAIDASLKVASN